jgi:hypothetical protein
MQEVFPTLIPEDRPLTAEEVRLARWMLEHGDPDGRSFLPQLERAHVVSRCPCGCATIDIEVDGHPPASGIGRILGEFSFAHEDDVSAIFIYEADGVLGGLEVYGLSGDAPKVLPAPEMLEPMEAVSSDPE